LDGLFEGFLRHLGLLHEAHGIFTNGDVSPDRVVPGSSSELEDSSDGIRLSLRSVSVVLVVVGVIESLLDVADLSLKLVNSLLNSLDSGYSSLFGTMGLSFLLLVLILLYLLLNVGEFLIILLEGGALLTIYITEVSIINGMLKYLHDGLTGSGTSDECKSSS
jgi:hypothetical protein